MIDDIVAAALERWRAGGFDRIECALVRAPRDVVVSLTEAYRMEPDASVREAIVYSIWKRRESENLEFLVDALRDPDRRVWQEALDGIVTLGSAHARASLVGARGSDPPEDRRQWIDEAIEQIDENLPSDA